MKKQTNCEHKHIELFDGIQEGYKTKFYFCLDCDKEIEYDFNLDYDEEIEYKLELEV